MGTSEAENQHLRERIASLNQQLANNELILKRAHSRELELLNAANLPDLLERLVPGLADSYGLREVTLVLCDPDHEVRHLLGTLGREAGEFPGVILVDNLLALARLYTQLRKPWLGPYVEEYRPLFRRASGLHSVALLPLMRQQALMGSLNFGSDDAERFTRYHATDILSHLASIASFCLENVINRARLTRSGFTDVLTGWHNRRYLQVRLREELARARRQRTSLACLLFDLDRFKGVNDRYGHLAGDDVLREVARRVGAEVRTSDVAARFGGEEFALLLPDTGPEDAGQMAERIRLSVRDTPVRVSDSEALTVTISIGVAMIEPAEREGDPRELGELLLQRADVALYRAKELGRDRVEMDAGD